MADNNTCTSGLVPYAARKIIDELVMDVYDMEFRKKNYVSIICILQYKFGIAFFNTI